jgi:hypothetical protein
VIEPIDSLEDIYLYADTIRETVRRYAADGSAPLD